MSKDTKPAQQRIDQFSSGPGGRADDWRDLVEAAKVWSRGGNRANYDAALSTLSVTEEYHGYPGLHLMAALKEAAASGDAATSLALSTQIAQALTTKSFRSTLATGICMVRKTETFPNCCRPRSGGERRTALILKP